MKTCTKCNLPKETTDFGKNSKCKDGINSICKECRRNYRRKTYKLTPKIQEQNLKNRDRAARLAAKYRSKNINKSYVRDHLLQSKGCVDCGDRRLIVLDFDHVRGDKVSHVSALMGTSLKLLKIEISKCEIRCSNCHRIKTAKDFGWYNSLESIG